MESEIYKPPAAHLETPASLKASPRRWWVAALLGLLFPLGLGQLYNGQWKKAVGVVLATCALSLAGFALVMWGPHPWLGLSLLPLVPMLSVVDAAVTARRLGAGYRRRFCNRWYVYLAWCFLAYWGVKGVVLGWSSQVAQSFYIPSGSMEPTLLAGDYLYLERWSPREREVERGDLVMFESVTDPGMLLLKRVVGLPGDRIAIRDKQLYLNGRRLDEPYAVHKDPQTFPSDAPGPAVRRDNLSALVIPAGEYFILGDNRDFSFDSRFWGTAPEDKILGGKNVVIYWSRDPETGEARWDRIGRVGD